jgi:hypothetical protein
MEVENGYPRVGRSEKSVLLYAFRIRSDLEFSNDLLQKGRGIYTAMYRVGVTVCTFVKAISSKRKNRRHTSGREWDAIRGSEREGQTTGRSIVDDGEAIQAASMN